jgi:hypothetical protein
LDCKISLKKEEMTSKASEVNFSYFGNSRHPKEFLE